MALSTIHISIKSRIISLKQISIKAKFRYETQPQKEPRIAPLTTNHISIKAKFKQEIQIKKVSDQKLHLCQPMTISINAKLKYEIYIQTISDQKLLLFQPITFLWKQNSNKKKCYEIQLNVSKSKLGNEIE